MSYSNTNFSFSNEPAILYYKLFSGQLCYLSADVPYSKCQRTVSVIKIFILRIIVIKNSLIEV